MNLMTVSTSFDKLKKKYNCFGAPTVRATVNGVEITEKLGAQLSQVTVELTSGYSASGCSFDIIGEYDPERTAFRPKGASKLVQLGAKVELELGYIVTVPVFYGLIVEIEYIFDNESAPYIHVECMDAKCLLMKQQRMEMFSDKSISDAIGEMFSEQPFSTYIKGKKIEPDGEKIAMVSTAMESDYQFISRYASRIGFEFFILAGKVYLRKTPKSASSILTLGLQNGLASCKMSMRGSGLYKKTTVVGISPEDDKAVTGKASVSGNFGKGSYQMLGDSEKILFDRNVTSAQQASDQAKNIMQSAQSSFARIECRCTGLPELVPGRNVKIKNVSDDIDRDYYIMNVRHTMEDGGFFTTIEGRCDRL